MAHIRINELEAVYGDQIVLKGIDLEIEKGEVLSLIGRSGSGKSTFLRALIGLTPPSRGEVALGGRRMNYADRGDLRWLRERMSMVFQQYNLFHNMTVLENIMVAPVNVQRRPAKEVRQQALALLARIGLIEKANAYPDQLSGGQQQRVAIARALALEPEILLFDEVTAALDPELVGEVLDMIRDLAKAGITLVVVSHEMGFVREVSSRVAFMIDGKLIELGTPADIFNTPQDARTRDFISRILNH